MKVDLAQKIGGLTLGDVRALFRKLNRNEMTFAMIGDGLCVIGRPLSRQAQRKLIDALIGAGYLKVNGEHDGQTVFQVTGLAFRLAASPTTNRFDRRTADRLVAELLDRVRTLNADAHNPVCAARVRAFGSYITEEDTLGDIDLVVELTTRYGANLGDELAHAKQFDRLRAASSGSPPPAKMALSSNCARARPVCPSTTPMSYLRSAAPTRRSFRPSAQTSCTTSAIPSSRHQISKGMPTTFLRSKITG